MQNLKSGKAPRIGFGYDVHRLVEGRKLTLGGVEIPHAKGLEGHSDADILLHALADALLGAAALGDIGKHFPNTDPRYKGISSLILLRHVADLLTQHRFAVNNIDVTVVLEKPQISPYIDTMRQNIAGALNISIQQISIKATTHEGLGFIGTEQGAAAHAVASIVAS
jgi:2-C-methyl-D-erythritol 2,4-cyclodiphosphate synthase